MNEADSTGLIKAIRDHYTQRLTAEFDLLRAARTERIHTEAALRRSDGAFATDGESRLGCRVDVVIPAISDFISVDSVSFPSFPPFRLQRGHTDFVIAPFQWDWCVITLECIPDAFSWPPILDWFHRWFDIDDTKLPDGRGLWVERGHYRAFETFGR